jgi:hypothetical protein
MTVFFYFLVGWAGVAAIALIVNYAIQSTDEDDD